MNYLRETFEYLSKIFQWWIIIQPWERAIRTRFGKHVKVLNPGTHLRIPFFDIVYIQTIRLRVASMSPQTLTTKCGKTITMVCAIGYSIADIHKLYNTLFEPEVTICNMVQGEISDYVAQHDLAECGPKAIEEHAYSKIGLSDSGIKYEYLKLTTYAVVRTYRLIQDGHWTQNNLPMNEKK